MKILSKEEYTRSEGKVCPHCKEKEVTSVTSIERDAFGAWREMACKSCGAKFIEQFRLDGYSQLSV